MILKRNRLFGTTRKKWFIIQQLFFYCQATIFLLSNSFRLLSFRLYLSISLSLWFHYHCYTWSLLIKPHIYVLCVCVCAMSFRVALMCLSLECKRCYFNWIGKERNEMEKRYAIVIVSAIRPVHSTHTKSLSPSFEYVSEWCAIIKRVFYWCGPRLLIPVFFVVSLFFFLAASLSRNLTFTVRLVNLYRM